MTKILCHQAGDLSLVYGKDMEIATKTVLIMGGSQGLEYEFAKKFAYIITIAKDLANKIARRNLYKI